MSYILNHSQSPCSVPKNERHILPCNWVLLTETVAFWGLFNANISLLCPKCSSQTQETEILWMPISKCTCNAQLVTVFTSFQFKLTFTFLFILFFSEKYYIGLDAESSSCHLNKCYTIFSIIVISIILLVM